MKRPILFMMMGALGVLAFGSGATTAEASLLKLEYSGVFGADSTLGGVAFGQETAFRYTAIFNPAFDKSTEAGFGVYQTIVEFDIEGRGTFLSDLFADVNVILEAFPDDHPRYPEGFGAGLGNSAMTSGFGAAFATSTPTLDPDAPGPTVLSDFLGPQGELPFTIPLGGSAGDLVIEGIVGFGATARIAAIPEPSSLVTAGMGVGLLSVASIARRARRRGESSGAPAGGRH